MTPMDSASPDTAPTPPAGGSSARLPAPPFSPLTWDPVGALVMRPWYDRLMVNLVAHWVLALSRAWAASIESGGDPARFAAALGLERLPGGLCGWHLERRLAEVQELARAHAGADAHWHDLFFGGGRPSAAQLVAAEQNRRGAAHRLMASRRFFICLRRRIDPLRWEVPTPAEMPSVDELRGDGGTCIRLPAGGTTLPSVEQSQWVPGPYGRQCWLRFASPGLPGDTAWAQVIEPEGAVNPPTLISLHGICVESEHWGPAMDAIDIAPDLARKGFRIIRPEGPWHGRRRLPGRFGGEPAMARGPLGFLTLFRAWGPEVAVLIDWARKHGSSQVALGGVSLGALTSQLTAVAARDWPARLRPDALILIACSESMKEIAFKGSLAAGIGLPAQLAARGWTEADVERYLPLMEPRGEPAVAPEKIVMTLGEADDLTPFSGGLSLARRWQVPPANLFLRNQGHFSVAFDLARRPQPLDRLAEILNGG